MNDIKIKQKVSFRLMMVTVFLGAFIVMLSSSTINLAIPFFMENFNTSLDIAKWTLTGFLLAMGTATPLSACLGERFSYKNVYLFSMVGFTLASILCVLSWNIISLIIFRILQGVFCGFVMPATMAMIYQVVPKEKQVAAVSIWSTASMLAPAVGPTLSGFLIQYFNWQSIFLINIPICIIIFVLGIKFMPYFKFDVPKYFDVPGFIFVLIGSLFLLIAFSEGASLGWSSWKILSLIIVGFVSLGLFIWRELSIDSPVLNIRIFKYPKYSLSIIVYCSIIVITYAGILLTPLFLQNIQNISALDTGIILLPSSLIVALLMPVVGKLYKYIDPSILIVTGILLMAVGSWKMAHLTVNTTHSYIIIWMVVRNMGMSFSTLPATYCGMSVLPKKESGHGSSINNWTSRAVASLSMGVFTSVLTSRTMVHVNYLVSVSDSKLSTILIQNKGFVMGINDVYLISFFILLIILPISIFLKRETKEYKSA
ncbi:DHA2 family efflux MFS transporter permease subunit [uncultured Clostridium sp.]|uniref:DHA2 family efflux MFS transporter permease subunit n=1 Tax=uncultured Clostridium sp. TaxID=59620 RepID=UPI0028E7D619|nr:DHA2 family efflux MFS transporter permease subunit [uncultured Clostridium sp.]